MEDKLKFFINESKESEYYDTKPNVFHSSECGSCPRKIFLDRILPISDSFETKKFFLLGNIFHEFIEKNLLNDYNCEKELLYEGDGFKIVGKADAYNDEEVIDIKTCKDVNYVMTPKKENIVQINIYMKILGLSKGKLVYVGKNDFGIREFKVNFDPDLFKETIKNIKKLNDKINNKVDLSEIDFEPSPNCYYCKNYKRCFPKRR